MKFVTFPTETKEDEKQDAAEVLLACQQIKAANKKLKKGWAEAEEASDDRARARTRASRRRRGGGGRK